MHSGLRTARLAKDWSQSRLLREIELYARQHLLDVASPTSLKVYISEWENRRRPVHEPYRTILPALLGRTAAELFDDPEDDRPPPFHSVDGYDELLGRIDSAHAAAASMVTTFREQTELFRVYDRQMGATALTTPVATHIGALQSALTFAVLPNARTPIARTLAEASTLAAWQALDTGAAERAWAHYETAKSAAREADDPVLLGHAMAEQAYVLADAGRLELAVQLAREGQRVALNRASARVGAWFLGAVAELSARAGDADGARTALDDAARSLPDGDEDRDPDLPNVFMNGAHLARWRGCTLTLLGDAESVQESHSALAVMDPTFTRAQAGLRCDLAQAHLVRGELDEAAAQLRAARQLANRTGSVRYLRRIKQLRQSA